VLYASGVVVNLPAEFLSTNSYQFILNENDGRVTFSYHERATKSQVKVGYACHTIASASFDWIAIGRWK